VRGWPVAVHVLYERQLFREVELYESRRTGQEYLIDPLRKRWKGRGDPYPPCGARPMLPVHSSRIPSAIGRLLRGQSTIPLQAQHSRDAAQASTQNSSFVFGAASPCTPCQRSPGDQRTKSTPPVRLRMALADVSLTSFRSHERRMGCSGVYLWTVHNLAHSPWDSQNARRRRRDHAAAAAVKALMLLLRTGLALRSATALLPMTS
jgi:hypothetical protein